MWSGGIDTPVWVMIKLGGGICGITPSIMPTILGAFIYLDLRDDLLQFLVLQICLFRK
jgi:hypothetical protein